MAEHLSRVTQYQMMRTVSEGSLLGTDITEKVDLQPIDFLPNIEALVENDFITSREEQIRGTMVMRPHYRITRLGQLVLDTIDSDNETYWQ